MINPISLLTIFLALCSAAAALWLRHERGLYWAPMAETATALFSGLVTTVFITGHLAAVTLARFNGEWTHRYNHRPPADVVFVGSFPYDFSFYSMMLVGALVLAAGVTVLRNVCAISRGNRGARAAAIKANALLSIVLVPLMPCAHFVALLLAPALVALSIGAVRAAKRRKPIVIRRIAAGVPGE